MDLLMNITIFLWWLYIVVVFLGALLCSLYSRYSIRCKRVTYLENPENSEGGENNASMLRKRALSQISSYCYGLCRYYSILIGRIPSKRIRVFLLKTVFCMKIAKKAVVYGGFEIRSPWNIQLGECVIGVNALLDGRNGIIIKDGCCLSQNVSIYTEQHDVNDCSFRTNEKGGMVYIDELAWISSRTTILPKVQVGRGSVLAAGGVATKNLEPYGIYVGVPAKRIAERNKEINYRVVDDYWHFY